MRVPTSDGAMFVNDEASDKVLLHAIHQRMLNIHDVASDSDAGHPRLFQTLAEEACDLMDVYRDRHKDSLDATETPA